MSRAKRPSNGVASRGPARVRIIGGRWKRTSLAVPDVPGLRPTPDRVRETLFNWLGRDLTGWHCLDLYAGSGALGLEAASRGAERVVLVERDPRAAQSLRASCVRLGATQVEVVETDALAWLARAGAPFDLVCLDPPFGSDALTRVAPFLARVLAPMARLYVEWHAPLVASAPPWSALPGWVLHRSGRAGQVYFHLLQPSPC